LHLITRILVYCRLTGGELLGLSRLSGSRAEGDEFVR
jgi:hypothetical protein